ncbi:MAG: hypothetical protein ACRCZE_03380 [Candidatus Altimarinota bacterium]
MFDYQNILNDPEALGQIIGAMIGVTGLFVGTFITIFTSFVIRSMDIKREERKERVMMERARKSKEFKLKQEVYTTFISELASLENFLTKKGDDLSELKDFEKFDREWTRIEIRVDLVASQQVQDLKEKLQKELFSLAKKSFETKGSESIVLSKAYMLDRSLLLQAIREDMEITKS